MAISKNELATNDEFGTEPLACSSSPEKVEYIHKGQLKEGDFKGASKFCLTGLK
jgi:hypothetical protein